MSGYLLDTNVISEAMSQRPQSRVRSWLNAGSEAQLFLSVITIGELRYGVELQRDDAPRSTRLHEAFLQVQAWFGGRILTVDEAVAARWGELRARARAGGRTLPVRDALIAATAIVHDLVVVTRNERDFRGTGVAIINPFAGTSEAEDDSR